MLTCFILSLFVTQACHSSRYNSGYTIRSFLKRPYDICQENTNLFSDTGTLILYAIFKKVHKREIKSQQNCLPSKSAKFNSSKIFTFYSISKFELELELETVRVRDLEY